MRNRAVLLAARLLFCMLQSSLAIHSHIMPFFMPHHPHRKAPLGAVLHSSTSQYTQVHTQHLTQDSHSACPATTCLHLTYLSYPPLFIANSPPHLRVHHSSALYSQKFQPAIMSTKLVRPLHLWSPLPQSSKCQCPVRGKQGTKTIPDSMGQL